MNYSEIIQNVLNNGVQKTATRYDSNGNVIPVENGTIGTFCEIFRHDMSKGFPLTTLRRMPFRSICAELEMFIKGVTDKQFLKDRKSKFWDYWCRNSEIDQYPLDISSNKKQIQEEVRDLGPIGYSHGWRNFGGYYYGIHQIYSPYLSNISNIDSLIDKNTKSKHVGKTYDSKSGPFVVIKCYSSKGSSKRSRFDILFKRTGFIEYNISSSSISRKSVKDPYSPSVFGVGCIGETATKADPLYEVWRNMISRCYYEKAINYKFYGEKGVRVCNRWLNASTFIDDVKKIPNWNLKVQNHRGYSLDKDLLGDGFLYSPSTCCWLSDKEQKRHSDRNRVFSATDSNGNTTIHECVKDFAKINNLDSSSVSKAIINNNLSVKGWTFEHLRFSKEKKAGFDQLKHIVDKIKSSPYDRRMVCSAWNPNEMDDAALPSCHYAWNVVVYGDKLNLVFHMRSADLLLGVGSNIASYALLLLLLCEESGLKPGELVGTLADCHIYENHLPAARELVERSEGILPEIKIKRNGEAFSIFNWTYDQVDLIGYNPQEKLDIGAVTV